MIKLYKVIAVALLMAMMDTKANAETASTAPCGPVPTDNQLRWQDMEMYAFIHYSLNTYTDQEWGFGNEALELFNPSDLDCRQWARVCKQAGMKGIIFTAKHHCGFCMWPSEYTEYSVKNTPWKNGKGDVVRELADACREEGLKFAVYLSPWDRNHPDYGKPEYVTYFRNQLRELLTNYGDIFEVWFDGANGGDGWYGGANETRRIDGKTYYGWAETFRMIRELQPKAVIWNDGGDRGDLRWVGTEAGNVGETNWSMMPGKGDTPWHMLHYGVETGRQLGEIHHLGTGLGGRYPEGPHIYKKDGYYYLLLAEGGTEHGHHVNILRSKNLFGPYQPNPDNPILSHFNMKMQNSQIQGLGHADLVQAPDSSWWMICLGYRTSGYLQHVMGRETMLAPVRWEQGGWPVVNGDGTLQTDMKCKTLPLVAMMKDPVREEFDYIKRDAPKDSYHSLGLPMGWMSLCTPDYSRYSLTERKGWLRLRPSTTDLSETASPTFIARRQTELNFTATALFDLSHLSEGMQTGITAYAAPLNHYDVVAEKRNGQIIIKSNVRLGQTSHSEKEFALSGTRAYLRITSDKDFYYLQASSDGKNFVELAKMEYRFLSTETIGGFTGVMLGLFTQSDNETGAGYADVDWFEYLTQ